MTTRSPAQPGDPVSAIDTPALVIDMDAFERNLDAMAAYAASSNMRLRPHAKTHKSPDVALAQGARGAVGQCCQKVSEAQVLVDGGISDVLVSNEVVGEAKVRRLAELAARASISVCADDAAQVAAYAQAARAAGVMLTCWWRLMPGQGAAAWRQAVRRLTLPGPSSMRTRSLRRAAGLSRRRAAFARPAGARCCHRHVRRAGEGHACRLRCRQASCPAGHGCRHRHLLRRGPIRPVGRASGRLILFHGRRLRPQPAGRRLQPAALRARAVHRHHGDERCSCRTSAFAMQATRRRPSTPACQPCGAQQG
jgi:hypothetical protein